MLNQSVLNTDSVRAFESQLQGTLIRPGDIGYDEARQVWNGVINRYPALIARCASVEDVVASANFARKHQLPVAVRGGGHNVAGHATIDDGLADAFISCWNAKYQYNSIRPITYIRRIIDRSWMPTLTTPPFPEYPSGHSVESSAAATILSDMFGDAYEFSDATHSEWGLPARSFSMFSEFADEAAVSRIYGGIHFRSAVENGLEQGACIAERVNTLHFRANNP